MAVRNLEAIKRQGTMIAQQKENARKMWEDNFWTRVNLIKSTHEDAIDFADTVDALYKNGLAHLFEKWLQSQNVSFRRTTGIINRTIGYFIMKCPCGNGDDANVYYYPYKNSVEFGCCTRSGMHEHYSSEYNVDYFIHTYLKGRYDEGLTMLSVRIKPFIDSFFDWVSTIK